MTRPHPDPDELPTQESDPKRVVFYISLLAADGVPSVPDSVDQNALVHRDSPQRPYRGMFRYFG